MAALNLLPYSPYLKQDSMKVVYPESSSTVPVPGQTEIKGRDIVIVGLQPWYYEIGSNCKNIALHLAKTNRVLYVNTPITRKTFLSKQKNPGVTRHCEIISDKTNPVSPIQENMWQLYPTTLIESINSLPSTGLFRILNYFNNRRFAKDIRKAVAYLGFKNIIIFNDNDIYNGFHLKELLSPSLYIYYCRDFLQGYAYWKKHTTVLEPRLIAKADLTTANSTFYAEYCAEYNKHSYYIGQGCSFDLFDQAKPHPVPDDMKNISSPIIGYVGAVDSARLDPGIFKVIASQNPEWNIVIVGPEDEFFTNSDLHSFPNVHFLGRKPLDQLAHYVNAFDICINPQLKNIVTRGNYPLKIDEYLAMGKPVVATRTEAMKLFEDHTYLADTPEEYQPLIRKAMQEDSVQQRNSRICFAKSHTWENSIKDLYQAMLKHIPA